MLQDFLLGIISSFGVIGIFFVSLISNATILFVIPIDLIVLIIGASNLFHPIVIALAAGIGAGIGEMSSYVLGMGGRKAFEKITKKSVFSIDSIAKRLESKWSFLFIIIASLTPIPLDLVGIAAGSTKYNWKIFFLGAMIGKIIRYSLVAYAGLLGSQMIIGYFGLK